MIRSLFITIVLSIALSACQASSGGTDSENGNGPRFINHPRPDLSVDFSAFEELGCTDGEHEDQECETSGALIDFMCDEIRKPSDLLGALEPSYPIAKCLVMPDRYEYESDSYNARLLEEDEYFYNIGGLFRIFIRYVIFRDNHFELVGNVDEFRNIFASINSPEEALSYALAVQDFSAYYGRSYASELDYLVEEIEDTHIETTQQGYLVHLFDYQQYGCGPHFTYSMEVLITDEGLFDTTKSEKIFKDPAEDNVCSD